MRRELWPHQSQAIEMLRQSFGSGKRRPVLQAPTGFGKTKLAAALVEGALAKQKRVIFTVPALSLVDQTVQAFWDDGVRDVGVIQGTHAMTDWSRPVQVASVQTLQDVRSQKRTWLLSTSVIAGSIFTQIGCWIRSGKTEDSSDYQRHLGGGASGDILTT